MKNSRIVTLATFAMVVFGGVETAFADSIYSFTTIDVPGATGGTSANGINNSGQISWEFSSTHLSCNTAAPVRRLPVLKPATLSST